MERVALTAENHVAEVEVDDPPAFMAARENRRRPVAGIGGGTKDRIDRRLTTGVRNKRIRAARQSRIVCWLLIPDQLIDKADFMQPVTDGAFLLPHETGVEIGDCPIPVVMVGQRRTVHPIAKTPFGSLPHAFHTKEHFID
jgi:hypothetical protein